MALIDELIATVEVRGADRAAAQLRHVSAASGDVTLALTALGAVGGALSLLANIGQIGKLLAEISGVSIAAQFMSIQISLENLTGSASKAMQLMREFRAIGVASPFSTQEVSRTGMQALGAGVPEQDVGRQLKALLNVAAFGNLTSADMTPFMRNIFQIKTKMDKEANQTDLNQMFARAPAVAKLFSGTMGLSPEESAKKLQGMSGTEVYQTLIKGGEGMAKMAAAAQALRNPLVVVSNALEQFQMIMEPTGKLLIGVLTPVVYAFGRLAEFLGMINEKLGGLAGLGVIALGATYALGRLTLTIAALGAAASASAFAGGGVAGAAAGRAAAGTFMAGGAMAAFGAGRGVLGRLPGLLKGGIAGFGISLGAEALGNYVAGDGENKDKAWYGSAIKTIGTTAGIGATIGGIGGGVPGALVGALIGAVSGVVILLAKGIHAAFNKGGTAADETAKNTKRTADAVEDLRSTVFGGGKRTRAGASQFEAEYTLSKSLEFAM